MKGLYVFGVIGWLLWLPVAAQPYHFSVGNQPYVEINGGTSINNGQPWSISSRFTIPIGFSFPFMDSSFTQVSLEASGRLVFDDKHLYFTDALAIAGIQDPGFPTQSLATLSYLQQGTAGQRSLIIQFKNASYRDASHKRINFQITLSEADQSISLHMGPHDPVNPSQDFILGPYAGVFHLEQISPITFNYGLNLTGSPTVPTDTAFQGVDIPYLSFKLIDLPETGTIYRFFPATTTSLKRQGTLYIPPTVYPNPVKQGSDIKIHHLSQNMLCVRIINRQGQLVIEESPKHFFIEHSSTYLLSTNRLMPGVYTIEIQEKQKLHRKNLVVVP